MATIGLCMIVRDEALVIRRCLAALVNLVDHWTVVDTGSADDTPDVAEWTLFHLPGELHRRPWVDFAHNRSEALALAQPNADYTLVMDADDVLRVPEGWSWPELTADSYALDIVDVGTTYRRPALVRNALAWRYRGVLHEFLDCDGAGPAVHLPGPAILRGHDGARRRDPDTYRRDAVVLERALLDEAEPMLRSRYAFYLAQSYRDCGESQKAIAAYLARAALGGWAEEAYCSLLYAGRLTEAAEPEAALELYARAGALCEARAEANHAASRLLRTLGRFAEGWAAVVTAVELPPPADGLFVEGWIYRYGLRDELAVNSYWAGDHRVSLDACLTILACGDLPDEVRTRTAANARFAADRLAAA